MTFKMSELSVLTYANNFTLWHYTTPDEAITGGYFNEAANMLRVNDLMIVSTDTDGTPSTRFYIVTGNDGTGVRVVVSR